MLQVLVAAEVEPVFGEAMAAMVCMAAVVVVLQVMVQFGEAVQAAKASLLLNLREDHRLQYF
jgi:hypothetical protein